MPHLFLYYCILWTINHCQPSKPQKMKYLVKTETNCNVEMANLTSKPYYKSIIDNFDQNVNFLGYSGYSFYPKNEIISETYSHLWKCSWSILNLFISSSLYLLRQFSFSNILKWARFLLHISCIKIYTNLYWKIQIKFSDDFQQLLQVFLMFFFC